MSHSLTSKLIVLRRSLKRDVKPFMLLDFDHITSIATRMPKTTETLEALIPESFVAAYGDKIIEVVTTHERDEDRFDDCVKEIDAFVRGDQPGMMRLNQVYTQIIKHFEMETDMEDVFGACKIYHHTGRNCLIRKRNVNADDEVEFQNSSQM